MAVPKIKICWSPDDLDAEWRLGLFGTYRRDGGQSRLRGLVVSLRGLLLWCFGLAVAAYFSAAAALYAWFERKPHNAITYVDLVLPTRWSSLKSLRGQAMIAEGIDDIKARRWGEGMAKLRVGIERYPDDTDGRLVLAELFIAMRARRLAVETYDGALQHRYPGRTYVEAMLRAAARAEDFAWSLRTCDRALALVAGRPELEMERRWLVQRKMDALIAADLPADAITLAEAEGEGSGPATKELHALALMKAGRSADAVAFLARWAAQNASRPDAQVLRLQARAYREAGDVPAMKNALEALRQLSPTAPRAYAYAAVQTLLAGLPADAGREIDRFLLRFGSNADAVLLMASAMADAVDPAATRRLIEHAREHGFILGPFVRVHVFALLNRRAWSEALTVLAQNPAPASAPAGEKLWRTLAVAQANAALDPAEAVQSHLVGLVRDRPFTPKFYRELILGLRAAGRTETARQIITFAQGVYPEHALIENWRKELDLEIAAAQAAKPEIQLARAAPAESKQVDIPGRKRISRESYQARLDELVRAGDYRAALTWLREVRLAKPDWLSASGDELALEEMRLAGRAGDLLGIRPLVRMFNNGDRQRTADLIRIARELHDAGRAEEAVFVIREVLAKTPESVAAKKLLIDWMPATEAGELP